MGMVVFQKNFIHGTEMEFYRIVMCGEVLVFFWLLKIFFLMWTNLQVFLEFVTISLLFFMCWSQSMWDPWPETELTPHALEAEALTTGPPGKLVLLAFKNSLKNI